MVCKMNIMGKLYTLNRVIFTHLLQFYKQRLNQIDGLSPAVPVHTFIRIFSGLLIQSFYLLNGTVSAVENLHSVHIQEYWKEKPSLPADS
jgi:hypothetical protein